MEDENPDATTPRAKATPTFHVLQKAADLTPEELGTLLANGDLWIKETNDTPHTASSKKAAMRHFAGEGNGEFVAIPAAHFQPKKRKVGEKVVKVTETWE